MNAFMAGVKASLRTVQCCNQSAPTGHKARTRQPRAGAPRQPINTRSALRVRICVVIGDSKSARSDKKSSSVRRSLGCRPHDREPTHEHDQTADACFRRQIGNRRHENTERQRKPEHGFHGELIPHRIIRLAGTLAAVIGP
jgi:hypothetical protein